MAARRMSPVVILGRPNRSARIFPWVPLPEPGAPRMRINTKVPARLAPEADPRRPAPTTGALHEPVVLAQEQVLLHLLHGVQGDAHDDEQGGAAEPERHVQG